jgi:hypothetical protein
VNCPQSTSPRLIVAGTAAVANDSCVRAHALLRHTRSASTHLTQTVHHLFELLRVRADDLQVERVAVDDLGDDHLEHLGRRARCRRCGCRLGCFGGSFSLRTRVREEGSTNGSTRTLGTSGL